MPIIQIAKDFWFEIHHIVRFQVLGGTAAAVDITLDKAGSFVGSSWSWDVSALSTELAAIGYNTRLVTGLEITYGLPVDAIRVTIFNGNAAARFFGGNLMVYLRS